MWCPLLLVDAFDECCLASKKNCIRKDFKRCVFLLVYLAFAGNVRTSTK